MAKKRMLTLRSKSDSNGHWSDISSGEVVDVRFKLWRSVSNRAFLLSFAAMLGLIGVISWQLTIQMESEVNPRKIAEKLEPSVFEVWCSDSYGTAFAISPQIISGYETTLVSVAHIFEDCDVGDTVMLNGRDGIYSATLVARSSSLFFDSNPSQTNDIALLGANFYASGLVPASQINRGDWAIAMGYPWGQAQNLSFGVVSDQNAWEVFVDTPLNEGNSGGPVVNGKGEVIGVVSYYPLLENLYPDNAEGISDRADGIAVLKKLTNICSLPSNIVLSCPFVD